MPDIHLRQARPDDAPALQAILRDTFESTWRPELTAEAARAFLGEDRPAAYVGARRLLFLLAEVHGGRLMDRAEAAIAAAGFPAARLETDTFNLRSQAFYAARGYVEAGRYPDEEWNSGLTTLLLVKALG